MRAEKGLRKGNQRALSDVLAALIECSITEQIRPASWHCLEGPRLDFTLAFNEIHRQPGLKKAMTEKKDPYLSLHWYEPIGQIPDFTEEKEVKFNNLQELGEFLRLHPRLADKVDYGKKRN